MRAAMEKMEAAKSASPAAVLAAANASSTLGEVKSLLGIEPGTNYIFLGNPGTGKSTMLNGITDTTKFQSGVSVGRGLTKVLQCLTIGDVKFFDSPGLADVAIKKEAAVEIQGVLNRGGKTKVFFVMTTESCRIRPADRATLQVILEAAPDIKHFGIIINKVEEGEYDLLTGANSENMNKLILMINNGLPTRTIDIHLIKRDASLASTEGGTNAKMPMPEALLKFIYSIPVNEMRENMCKDLCLDDNFQPMVEFFEKKLKELAEDKEFYMQARDEEKENMKMVVEAHKKHNDQLVAMLDAKRSSGALGDLGVLGDLMPMLMNVVPPLVQGFKLLL